MYRLLIVDDEAGHRSGMSALLRTLKPDYLLFEAENGGDALRLLSSVRIDLALTDIRMPKMDGLSFIERAKAARPDMRIAALSAYDRFDYAKRCVALGADDYLLKPVSPEELLECLRRMESRLEAPTPLSLDTVENHMYLFLTDDLPLRDRDEMRTLFGVSPSGFVAVTLPGGRWPSPEARQAAQFGLRAQLKTFGPAAVSVSPVDEGALVAVTACQPAAWPIARDVLTGVVQTLRNAGCPECAAGVSWTQTDFLGRLPHVYHAARTAAAMRFYEPASALIELPPQKPAFIPRLGELRTETARELSALLASGNRDDARRRLRESLNALRSPRILPSRYKETLLYLFLNLFSGLPMAKAEADAALAQADSALLECNSVDEAERTALQLLDAAADALTGRKAKDNVFEEALAWLQAHYHQDVTLSAAAARFHYNPTYFSEQFKAIVGMTFSDYLIALRMAQAAKLLRETRHYAAAVGRRVGYPNAATFTKTFKKHYGITPDQYRRNTPAEQDGAYHG
ncbi:MAG: response regulator [Oscillospiraceae bacterium]|jgi:two-component system response regulator YesN|nr:response regulator [Oscillospiraceae bacterium]